MDLNKLRYMIECMYFEEKDPHTKKVIDKIWREIPHTGEVKDIPCFVNKKSGYKWKCWIRDDIIPRGQYPCGYSGYVAQRTYALVEDRHGNIIKVLPEKIRFDLHEADRWEDLHG